MTLRFLLDEDVTVGVAAGLRARGIDAISVHEVGRSNQGIGDDEQLQFAVEQGRVLVTYNRGDYQTSIAVYRSAARAAPTNAMAQAYLGDAYFNLERFDDARTAYEAALRIDPQDVVSLSGMIKVLVKQGDVAGARQALDDRIDGGEGVRLRRIPEGLSN